MIHNSSFGSLELNPATKANIIDCYIDGKMKQRPTLITANNSDVLIEKCHFENFINEKRSTVLLGHNNSQVTIENSVFFKHKSSKGILFLRNNSSMQISSSLISQSIRYSAISLQDRVTAVLNNTVFRNNSALAGGAMYVEYHCQVTLANCTFSSNKAITGKTSNISKNSNLQIAAHTSDQNNIEKFETIKSMFFNQTSSEESKAIAADQVHLPGKRSFFMKNFVHQNGPLIGIGGAIFITVQSQLLVTSCAFEDNSAQSIAGAIMGGLDVTLNIQETKFVRNKALMQSGAIDVEQKALLEITNCTFEDNSAQSFAGAITALINVVLDIQKTTFVGNKVLSDSGGAINVEHQSHLRITNCTFEDNSARRAAGAIMAGLDARLNIQGTTFVGNTAVLDSGGAIDAEQQVHIRITNCRFEDNSAQRAAGAIISGLNATLDIQGTTFIGNRALQGGAIYVEQHTQLGITNSIFQKNSAQSTSAAIGAMMNATVEIQGTIFVGNKASHGGAINVERQSHLRIINCTFENNSAQRFAGAVRSASNVTLEIQETTFVGNKALKYHGGAIYIQQQVHLRITNSTSFVDNLAQNLSGAIGAMQNVTLEIQEASFVGNKTLSNGGAINAQDQVHVSITNCTFEDNSALNMAGAVTAGFNATLYVQETTFVSNKALVSDGGAINVQQQSYLRITNCLFNENTARSGGALATVNIVALDVQDTNFTGNNAAGQGGAIAIGKQSHLHIKDCTFEHNHAESVGGALVGFLDAVLDVQESSFTHNSAPQGGAIIVQQQVNLFLTKSRLDRNFASHDFGGGILAKDNAKLEIRETNFTGNSASLSDVGGALYISQSQCHVVHCLFHSNIAGSVGGAVWVSESLFQIENTNFTNNNGSDGGAIYIDSRSNLQANSCHFLLNHGTQGGAITLNNPEQAFLRDTLFLRNVASGDGGAIRIIGGTDIIINNITCVGNQAPSGGCLNLDSVTLTLNNSEISENVAGDVGAGVFASNSRIQVQGFLMKLNLSKLP